MRIYVVVNVLVVIIFWEVVNWERIERCLNVDGLIYSIKKIEMIFSDFNFILVVVILYLVIGLLSIM